MVFEWAHWSPAAARRCLSREIDGWAANPEKRGDRALLECGGGGRQRGRRGGRRTYSKARHVTRCMASCDTSHSKPLRQEAMTYCPPLLLLSWLVTPKNRSARLPWWVEMLTLVPDWGSPAPVTGLCHSHCPVSERPPLSSPDPNLVSFEISTASFASRMRTG